VAVQHRLARLKDGAGKAGTQHQSVETHLEQLDKGLTGQARLLASLRVGARHLLLAQAVLGAQTLLLAQTHRVVAFLAAGRAAVLTGRVGALLEVLDGLGRQGDAEGAGKAHLAARTLNRSHDVLLMSLRA